MEDISTLDQKSLRSKKGGYGSPPKPGPGRSPGLTKFVLKTEKELEKSAQQRGRKMSRASNTSSSQSQEISEADSVTNMEDSSFGVQSLEETISSTFRSGEHSLSRTTSNSSHHSSHFEDQGLDMGIDDSMIVGRKRKVGNRVHPTIHATGQRIISSDRVLQVAGISQSTSKSPSRQLSSRRGSNSSSIHLESQPPTPVRLSPHPESTTPSTPRSGSPKSFRLSDEESVDDTNSQVATSSSHHCAGPQDSSPQLVMPSLSVPTRRPFTEQGRQIGRSKIMVVGKKGVGKTSFVNSMYRCEHIVHMDGISNTSLHSSTQATSSAPGAPDGFVELKASTRPYPSWWTDFESRRMLLRQKSVGEGVLERNLTFIDTPGVDSHDQTHQVVDYVTATLRQTAKMETMSDSDLVGLLSGDGGTQIDAVIYLFDSRLSQDLKATEFDLSSAHQELLQNLCKLTNLIPVISHSDMVTPEMLAARKQQISNMLSLMKVEPYRIMDHSSIQRGDIVEPLAVSFAHGEDAEIDASVLMSSQYLSPLVPSELETLLLGLFYPEHIARMRHLAAAKFLLWRQQNLGHHLDVKKRRLLDTPYLRSQSPELTSTDSISDEPSKVIVPHSSSSYYRSASPATSDISGNPINSSNSALAQLTQQEQPSEPFRQVRLAKWAQDLQRSLANERRKYIDMYNNRPSEWSSDSDKVEAHALALTPPEKGRLGGDLSIIDPRDPLGVLAFSQSFRRRGYFVVKLVGGCGLLGAAAYWIMKNWSDVQDFLGVGGAQSSTMINAVAIPPPSSRHDLLGWIDEQYLRGFFGWK